MFKFTIYGDYQLVGHFLGSVSTAYVIQHVALGKSFTILCDNYEYTLIYTQVTYIFKYFYLIPVDEYIFGTRVHNDVVGDI